MKNRPTLQILSIMLVTSAILAGGCGTMELGIINPEPANAGLGIPDGVIVAREIALMHLRETYGSTAPPVGLQWQGDYVEQGELVGSGAYRFTSGSWMLNIEYPIVAPEATVYSIELINDELDFQWQGQVDARGGIIEQSSIETERRVTAWLGHIASAPPESGADHIFVLRPEGSIEFELTPAGTDAQSAIDVVSDGQGPEEFVHVWGSLTCGVDAYTDCRLTADRIRYGTTITEPEVVDAWEGVIQSRNQPPGSGGDDYFVLAGDYPIEYGIWSRDENLRTELEDLRDSGVIIRIWGELVAGIPDWAGTQIRVERFEQIGQSTVVDTKQPTPAPVYPGWEQYVNERYGYEIQFPAEASLEEMGIHGYEVDANGNPVGDIPEGLEPDEIFEYLREAYGENLCVQIGYALGYITISVPENTQFRYATCGRTGVGVAEVIPKEERIEIDGVEVLAKGNEFRSGGESLAEHNETYHILLADGTRIEFGSRPAEDATYQDYLTKTKPILLEILATYLSR